MNKIINISILLLFLIANYNATYGQDNLKSKLQKGIGINTFYDFHFRSDFGFDAIRCAPIFSIESNRHLTYIGPQIKHLLPPKHPDNIIYNHNGYGLNFGYRYYSNEIFPKARIFGQFDYSFIRIKYTEYQHFSSINKIETTAINTLSLGIDDKLSDKLHASFSMGFCSNILFPFVIFGTYPTSNLCIEYKI